MRTVRFELMRPDEINGEKERFPVIYLPIAPLEWHSKHLPLGTDPLLAEAVARLVAEKTGGVILPTFYWGTDIERSKEMLKNIGFSGDECIVGMDFPANTMPSLYLPEDIFYTAVKEYLKLIVTQGYRLIVLLSGHGGENQVRVIDHLVKEFTATAECTVISTLCTISGKKVSLFDNDNDDGGHATLTETSIISYLYPDCIDVNLLPPKGEPIYITEWAIVDGCTFNGKPNSNHTVSEDPRDATVEIGRKAFESLVNDVSNIVEETLTEIM